MLSDEITVTKDELVELFQKEILKDDNSGWLYDGSYVEIVAIHEKEPKYIVDITNAEHYKIIFKN
jgi:hypothetical protein